MAPPYTIVEFVGEKSCAGIPTSWLKRRKGTKEKYCLYPNCKMEDVRRFIKNLAPPDPKWSEINVKI